MNGNSNDDMRYDNNNDDMRYEASIVVTERVSATVLQLYLISTPAQILQHVIEFQRRIKDSCHFVTFN